jgi:hypothetical protein
MATSPTQPPIAGTGNQTGVGVPMSPDDVEQLKRFREKFFPDTRLAAEDTYAKWLFGLTTTVAAIASGFSNAAFSKLSSKGIDVYALAVVAAGIGLTFAAFALSVELPDANWQSLGGMIAAFKSPLRWKKWWLILATLCLGASFVLAAFAVVATTRERSSTQKPSGLSLRLSERKLEPSISLSGLRPGAPAELEVFEVQPNKTNLIGVYRQIADGNGQISYKGPEFKIPSEAQGLKIELTYDRGENTVTEKREYSFPSERPEPKKDSADKDHNIVTPPPKEADKKADRNAPHAQH